MCGSVKTLLLILLLPMPAACGGAADPQETAERVRVEDLQYTRLESGARILTGELLNVSDEAIPNAQIQISLFDANNRRVGNMIIPLQNIGPGERKRFREPVKSEEDVHGARVRSVLIL